MKRQIIIVAVAIVVAMNFFGCTSSDRSEETRLQSQNVAVVAKGKTRGLRGIGMPNPAAVYCHALGYKYEIVTDDEGNQCGICIFPDGTACLGRDFYRGKCGQEWSYCERCGYELKDLGPRESLLGGAICIDKNTREEIGSIFDLVVDRVLQGESLPELRR